MGTREGQVFLCPEPSRVTAIITEMESCLTRAKKVEEGAFHLSSALHCHEHYGGRELMTAIGEVTWFLLITRSKNDF